MTYFNSEIWEGTLFVRVHEDPMVKLSKFWCTISIKDHFYLVRFCSSDDLNPQSPLEVKQDLDPLSLKNSISKYFFCKYLQKKLKTKSHKKGFEHKLRNYSCKQKYMSYYSTFKESCLFCWF